MVQLLSVKTCYYSHCMLQRKPLHETFATQITHNSCKFDSYEWNWLPNVRLFAVIAILEIEKFFGDFVFSSSSSLIFFAFCMHVPYKVVPYKKACIELLCVIIICNAESIHLANYNTKIRTLLTYHNLSMQ